MRTLLQPLSSSYSQGHQVMVSSSFWKLPLPWASVNYVPCLPPSQASPCCSCSSFPGVNSGGPQGYAQPRRLGCTGVSGGALQHGRGHFSFSWKAPLKLRTSTPQSQLSTWTWTPPTKLSSCCQLALLGRWQHCPLISPGRNLSVTFDFCPGPWSLYRCLTAHRATVLDRATSSTTTSTLLDCHAGHPVPSLQPLRLASASLLRTSGRGPAHSPVCSP